MITHVAIWRDDVIYALPRPNRHHNIFPMMHKIHYNSHTWDIQGFLDDNNNFLSRSEAFQIATAEGQIARNPNPANYQGNELFSEDLW